MMLCHVKVDVDLRIVTAATPLHLSNIEFLLLEAPKEKLLLDELTLQSIGVDLDGVFEQLTQLHIDAAETEADDMSSDLVDLCGATDNGEVYVLLHGLIDGTMDAGFEPTMTDDLRQLVLDYSGNIRVCLVHEKAAHEQPLEVHLEEGSQHYRSGVHRFLDVQRQFLQEYVRELESAGLVERNMQSRWACPALPVTQRGTDEFRITIGYRLLECKLKIKLKVKVETRAKAETR
ncbi:hypothetical protein PF010_g5399 [Phytophthora fragariae]|uniref:Uncharacterized protein n=1 Tax=Phytophthora fragariae TaxID=53985 RepID=A0A6G0PF73_9STRA|nr:hypothetical protein PF010_g5399 [Phytophthora fragariae]KAE9244406.1 hypothetical protein PF004_g5690 [Phytophthora fragariae]